MRERKTRSADLIVTTLRGTLRIKGAPSERDAWRIAALYPDRITVEVSDLAERAYSQRCRRGLVIITIPSRLDGMEAVLALLEELGHAFEDGRLSVLELRHLSDADRRRLHALLELRSECDAVDFRDAWLLPDELLVASGFDAEELRRETGLPMELIARRISRYAR